MSRYIKDKKIKVYRIETESDAIGNFTRRRFVLRWNPIWAYVRQVSMDKAAKYDQIDVKISLEFIINYHKDLDLSDVIYYRGQWYEIKEIDYYENNKGDLTIYSDIANAHQRPFSLDQIIE